MIENKEKPDRKNVVGSLRIGSSYKDNQNERCNVSYINQKQIMWQILCFSVVDETKFEMREKRKGKGVQTVGSNFMFRSLMYEFQCYVLGGCWFLKCG